MRICVTSAFRDCSDAQLLRWVGQVRQLALSAGSFHDVCAIAVEGDSKDYTHRRLCIFAKQRGIDLKLVKQDLGTPRYGSTEDPARMAALSKVLNEAFDNLEEDVDMVMHVESDLIWSPETVIDLIDLVGSGRDIVAPLVFAGEHFYDVWGFRGMDGSRFAPFPPYHASVLANQGKMTEVSSVGSCLVMRGDIARQVRIENGGALVGWCENARSKGHKIWVEPRLAVRHPA